MATTGDKLAMRVVLMLQRFNNGERLTIDEMAEEFGVDVRTIQRDLKRFSFLPIEKEHGRYCLSAYALGKLGYDDLKNFSHISGISELYPKLDEKTIIAILNPKINCTIKIKGQSYEEQAFLAKHFNALSGAIMAQRKMVFTYKEKSRTVEPYKLFNTNGIWYLVALEEGVVKHFTLSKLDHLTSDDAHFEVDDNIVDMIEENDLNWITQDPIEVTLRIDAAVSEYFLRRDLLPCQQIVQNDEDALVVTSKVTFEEEILRTVRYWIPHITIVSPSHLQEKLEKSLKNYLNV
jgi:predicted DNA-binding transcriptional regulator YafY